MNKTIRLHPPNRKGPLLNVLCQQILKFITIIFSLNLVIQTNNFLTISFLLLYIT